MNSSADVYFPRIQHLMPDQVIRSAEIVPTGLWNNVVIVNRELVFRFAKDERAREVLETEASLLQALGDRISLAIPRPSQLENDVLVYPYIVGEPLSRATFLAAGEEDRNQWAAQLGQFLRQLHSTPLDGEIPTTLAPVTRDAWEEISEEIRELVFPLLLPHQIHWSENLLDEMLADVGFFDYEPVVIHGDLAPHHILYQKEAAHISGILDFGVAGRGDPASDLALLIQAYGETITDLILDYYPVGKKPPEAGTILRNGNRTVVGVAGSQVRRRLLVRCAHWRRTGHQLVIFISQTSHWREL